MVLFSLTAVGSPSIYAELMYAAWPDNICFKSSSLPPRKAFRMAYLSLWLIRFLLSAFFEVLSLSITISTRKYYVTIKEPAMFCSANFPRLPRKFHWLIPNNFRLSRQEETINGNKQNKTQQKIDIYIFVFVSPRPKLKEKCLDLFITKYSVFTSCSRCCVYSRAAFILKLYLSRLTTRLNHFKNFM